MSGLKKVFKKFSPRVLWQTWNTAGALKFLPTAVLRWFIVLIIGAVLSVVFAILAILTTSDGGLQLKVEDNSVQKKPSVLNAAELNRILNEYKVKSEMFEELKQGAPETIDPSR